MSEKDYFEYTYNFRRVKYRGKELPYYYLDEEGNVHSIMRGSPKKLSISYRDGYPYPQVGLTVNGKTKTLLLHRIVCETFHDLPMPDILTDNEWKKIPEEIKNKLLSYIKHADRYQVNHIDHDGHNYHPDNLEWVTVSENQQKYQEYKKKNSFEYFLSMR